MSIASFRKLEQWGCGDPTRCEVLNAGTAQQEVCVCVCNARSNRVSVSDKSVTVSSHFVRIHWARPLPEDTTEAHVAAPRKWLVSGRDGGKGTEEKKESIEHGSDEHMFGAPCFGLGKRCGGCEDDEEGGGRFRL